MIRSNAKVRPKNWMSWLRAAAADSRSEYFVLGRGAAVCPQPARIFILCKQASLHWIDREHRCAVAGDLRREWF